jgi:hypothetical protein
MNRIIFMSLIFAFSAQSADHIICKLESGGKEFSKDVVVAFPNETLEATELSHKNTSGKINASYVLGGDYISLKVDFKTKRNFQSTSYQLIRGFPLYLKQRRESLTCMFGELFDDSIGRNTEIFKLAKADPNSFFGNESLLYFAARNKNEKLVTYLLSLGANPLFANVSGNTPLMAAASFENLSILKAITKVDKNTITQKNKNGWDSLMFSAKNNNISALKYLLENGAPINGQDKSGRSALMIAAKKGNFLVVKELVKFGANLDLKRSNGMTALMLARKYGHLEIENLLLENGASTTIGLENGPDFDWDLENEDIFYSGN